MFQCVGTGNTCTRAHCLDEIARWLTRPEFMVLPDRVVLQVVVHNLPWSCQWQQLKDHFKEWRAERADVVYDAWGRSR